MMASAFQTYPLDDPAEVRAAITRHQLRAPVDVVAIARDIGINVFKAPLGPKIAGVLRRDKEHGGRSGFIILVRDGDPKNRQRFTVAHEIGHFVLHRSSAESGIEDDEFYRALSGPMEREANEFAADILMPWELINQLQGSGIVKLNDIAKRLAVSRQALAIRLGLPYDENWD
jgi:Zn-dependent peptidase ImmA (M78 family)